MKKKLFLSLSQVLNWVELGSSIQLFLTVFSLKWAIYRQFHRSVWQCSLLVVRWLGVWRGFSLARFCTSRSSGDNIDWEEHISRNSPRLACIMCRLRGDHIPLFMKFLDCGGIISGPTYIRKEWSPCGKHETTEWRLTCTTCSTDAGFAKTSKILNVIGICWPLQNELLLDWFCLTFTTFAKIPIWPIYAYANLEHS